jgi:hypothetical protein
MSATGPLSLDIFTPHKQQRIFKRQKTEKYFEKTHRNDVEIRDEGRRKMPQRVSQDKPLHSAKNASSEMQLRYHTPFFRQILVHVE